MKKEFQSFTPCLELREVVFLRTLPAHNHLVPALDIFLDPFSKKLHICMEYMEGNLYQLMKARDHKCLDNASVKSVLFQIMQGLEHIHAHHALGPNTSRHVGGDKLALFALSKPTHTR